MVKPGYLIMTQRANRNPWNENTLDLQELRISSLPGLPKRLWPLSSGTGGEFFTSITYLEVLHDLLRSVRQSIKEKRRGKIRRGILVHQDSASVHTSQAAMDAMKECGYELVPHPPYSPDLAPREYHLFGNLKTPSWEKI